MSNPEAAGSAAAAQSRRALLAGLSSAVVALSCDAQRASAGIGYANPDTVPDSSFSPAMQKFLGGASGEGDFDGDTEALVDACLRLVDGVSEDPAADVEFVRAASKSWLDLYKTNHLDRNVVFERVLPLQNAVKQNAAWCEKQDACVQKPYDPVNTQYAKKQKDREYISANLKEVKALLESYKECTRAGCSKELGAPGA